MGLQYTYTTPYLDQGTILYVDLGTHKNSII